MPGNLELGTPGKPTRFSSVSGAVGQAVRRTTVPVPGQHPDTLRCLDRTQRGDDVGERVSRVAATEPTAKATERVLVVAVGGC